MTHIVVVGGGIAGLATAWSLREAGYPGQLTVLERDSRWGGKIRTEQVGPYLLEGGPESLLSHKPQGVQLAQKLGLEPRLINTRAENNGVFIWSGGRLQTVPEGFTMMVPTEIMPLLRTGLLSWWGKLRMGLDLFIPPRTDTADESIGAFVRRRLGSECLERIAEPMLAGIYAADADELSIHCTFPRFVDMERQYGSLVLAALAARRTPPPPSSRTAFVSFQNGLSELVDALHAALRSRDVKLRCGVNVQAWTPDGVVLDGEKLAADVVVLAVPAFAAAALLRGSDTALSDALGELHYKSSATVTLAWPEDQVRRPLQGFGLVVPRRERRAVLACTWTSSKWGHRAPPGKALIRAYIAGHTEVADEQLIENVKAELTDIMDAPTGPPDLQELRRIEKGTPLYRVGHLDWVTRVERMATRHRGLFLTGSAYRGIGIPDCIREGERTAGQVMAALQQKLANRPR
ncbi:MAG TPA: protoporphyrinogen oxidase [Candidatus Xenobia bacterium]